MVSGLLNILGIFDAFAGPLAPPMPKKRQRDGDEEAEPAAKPKSDVQSPDTRVKN